MRNQDDLHTELSVVAHQQESAILGQSLQTVDVRSVEVDKWCEPVVERVDRPAHRLDPRGRIHGASMFTAVVTTATRGPGAEWVSCPAG
jgi:hypothetical protein